VLLLPLVVLDAFYLSQNHNCLTCPQWTEFFLTVATYASTNVCFVQALKFTAVGNAIIFANSQAILLLLGKFSVGQPVLFLEGSGALIAFIGAILCSKDLAAAAVGRTGKTQEVEVG
jgi:drug/metabolite transporter (DMT)-like permease